MPILIKNGKTKQLKNLSWIINNNKMVDSINVTRC